MPIEGEAEGSLGPSGAAPVLQKPARRGKIPTIVVAALLLAAILAIVVLAIYQNQVAPFRTTVLVVDGKRIDMGYFLKRARMSGQPPLAVLQALTFEEIVKAVAPMPPYGIEVSEDEIDSFLRDTARGGSASMAEDELAEWYRQQLNESRLSDGEFRDLTRAHLLIRRLQEQLAGRVPRVAEQVHLHMITQPSRAAAAQAKARLDAGADFRALAEELNTDPELGANGGDLGWRPRAGLAPNLARIVFGELEVGEASAPLALDANTFVLLMVSEKAAARAIAEDDLEAVRSSAFDDWIAAEFRNHEVAYHGFRNGYDSATDAWVRGQIERMNAMAGGVP